MRRFSLCALAIFLVGSSVGCSLLNEMRPVRLKRLNYGINGTPASAYDTSVSPPNGISGGYYASVADDLPTTKPPTTGVSPPTR